METGHLTFEGQLAWEREEHRHNLAACSRASWGKIFLMKWDPTYIYSGYARDYEERLSRKVRETSYFLLAYSKYRAWYAIHHDDLALVTAAVAVVGLGVALVYGSAPVAALCSAHLSWRIRGFLRWMYPDGFFED